MNIPISNHQRKTPVTRNTDYLPKCTKYQKLKEYKAQSRLLFEQWWKEVKTVGYWESTTATAFATHPVAIKYLCDRLELHDLKSGDRVEEFGPGGGAVLREVLRRVDKEIEYKATEINPKIAQRLIETTPDSRLEVRITSATKVGKICTEQDKKASIVLTSIPFSSNKKLTQEILKMTKEEVLKESGKLLVWNFNPISILRVMEVFGWENCEIGFCPFSLPGILTIMATKRSKEPDNTKKSLSSRRHKLKKRV